MLTILQIKIWILANDKLIFQFTPQICLPVVNFLFLKFCLHNLKKLRFASNQIINKMFQKINNNYKKNCYQLTEAILNNLMIKNHKTTKP